MSGLGQKKIIDIEEFANLPKYVLGSIQHNTVVELLGEGEIEGSATASKAGITDKTSTQYLNAFKKDIFLNNTQVLQEGASNDQPVDSDFNFEDVDFDFRLGTADQTFIEGINSVETEFVIGTNVTASSPVTHTVTSSDVNAVRVTLRFPALQRIKKNGGITGAIVEINIKTIENDGTTTTVINDEIRGKTSNAYFREYNVEFKSTTSFPVAVRVERVTADSTSARLINAFEFRQATNIIFEQNAYPNTAHVAIRFSASQFARVPTRLYRIRGRKIKIPHNATVDLQTGAITYAGTFNGTFKTDKEWTTDPAWILYDLLTDTRAGCGIAESSLDKFAFKTVSEYCGEQVDDGSGTGSTEPRFSCNVNITQQREAYDLINELSSVMRVMPFYSAGGISISQDAPKTASYLFTNANVIEGNFIYSGSSLKTRHTVVNVSYFDMLTKEIDVETVEADASTQAKYGIVVKNIQAFATTSRGQAARLGKWILHNEQNSGETCTFGTTAAAGALVRCGDIIEILDSLKASVRRGGLLKSVTNTTTVVLDDTNNTNIPNLSDNPTISIMLPDGTLEQKTISNISDATITVSSAFSTAPNEHAPYIIETPNLPATTWRVLNVKENEDRSFTINALLHDSGKYAAVEDGTALPTRNVSLLTARLDPPSGLSVTENITEINNKAVSKLFLDWESQTGANRYEVQYSLDDGEFKKIETFTSEAEIFNSDSGEYQIRVFSFNAIDQPSIQPATLVFNAVGKTAPPSDITNLTYEPISDKEIRLRWDAVPDIDVRAGGRIHVRHSPKTDGSGTFSDATDLVFALSGASTEKVVPLLEGEYILKTQDDGDRFSTGETSIVIDLPEAQPKLLVQARREDQDSPKFQGSKTNVGFDTGTNSISLAGLGNFDDITDFDTENSIDDIGGVSATGTYLFNETLDLGAVYSLDLRKIIQTDSVYSSDLIDSVTDIDARQDFDGTASVDTNAEVFVQTSQDATSYSDFQKFANGTFKGRAFKFKCVLTTQDTNQDIRVSQLGYFAEFQRRTEQSTTTIASGAGAKSITFDHQFFTGTSALLGANSNPPAIGITALNMASGDFFELSSITGTGFTVHFKNSSGSSIDRNFNFTATGFGKG